MGPGPGIALPSETQRPRARRRAADGLEELHEENPDEAFSRGHAGRPATTSTWPSARATCWSRRSSWPTPTRPSPTAARCARRSIARRDHCGPAPTTVVTSCSSRRSSASSSCRRRSGAPILEGFVGRHQPAAAARPARSFRGFPRRLMPVAGKTGTAQVGDDPRRDQDTLVVRRLRAGRRTALRRRRHARGVGLRRRGRGPAACAGCSSRWPTRGSLAIGPTWRRESNSRSGGHRRRAGQSRSAPAGTSTDGDRTLRPGVRMADRAAAADGQPATQPGRRRGGTSTSCCVGAMRRRRRLGVLMVYSRDAGPERDALRPSPLPQEAGHVRADRARWS